MRKGIFKMMSAAVVATALVSCADDLGFSNANKQQKSDLTATIENSFPITRMGMIETGTAPYEDAANSDWGLGWTEGDQIRVFTTKQLVYNSYELNPASANTLEGDFLLKKKELNAADIVGENLYAITDAQFVYGVSATPEGEARLTYTIPYRWNASTTQETNKAADAVNVRKFPAPYWGIATPDDPSLAENTGMSVGTKALTAFVRVDMDKLPTGTKYVVFTTHGNAINVKNENGDEVKDGFYLAAPQPNGKDPEGFSDKLTWWAGETSGVANAQFITNGKSEPLSGTFNTILNAEDPTKSWLTPDEGLEDNANVTGQDKDMMYEGLGFSRLVTRDEIIIELTPNTPAVFYVPIIVRGGGTKLADDGLRYENLHVIAATKLSKYAYAYVGTEIYNFHQERFYRGQFKFLSLNFQDLGDVCPAELNKAIELANNRADRTSILNVGKLIKCNHEAHTTAKGWNLNAYPVNRINVSGTGKLVLNLKAIEDGTGAALASATGAVVTDLNTGGSPALYVTTAKAVPEGAIQDKVTINLPQNLGTTTATAEKPALLSNLPAYNVVIGSIDGKDLTKWTAYVKGSKTKCVTGHNVLADGETLKDIKDAGINVVAGLNTLNVLEGTTGDLFINQINEVEEPEILNVNIETANQIDILITNGLVESLNFASRTPSNEAYVYTTGSSAIQKVLPITAVNDNVATVATEGIPSNVSMYSYWTGAALSQKALKATSATIKANATKDYDIATVYTVAQLASVGEGKGADADDGVKYNIPHKLVKDMWLGAKTYRWIGAQATVAGFSLNGENVPLRKMAFQDQGTIAGDGPYYVDDPHMCCTTCGWQPAIYSTATPDGTTALTSLGLIRYYYNNNADDAVLIENVNLSDVWFETTNGFENIGSIIGMVVAKGAFTMQNNNVTEPKFNVAGKNIGGMAGGILSNGGVTLINNNIQDTDDEAGYIKSTGSYVGGLVGALDDYGKSAINNNVVDLDGNIEGDSNVGGIAGQFSLHDESEVIGNTVDVDDILATNSYAGGIAGKIKKAAKLIFGKPKSADRQTESVIADNIKAGENFAGGFAGYLTATDYVYVCEAVVDVETELSAGKQFAGGLFGSTNVPGNKVISRSADIEVGTLKAAEGFAGGEIGYVEAGNVFVGSKREAGFINLVTDIDITKLSGAYAVGGVIGGNSSNSEIELATAKMGTEAEPANNTIDINVAGWENLKKDAPGFATYFDPAAADSKSHKAGTHSNVIGYLTGDINIIIAKDFDGTTPLMTVTDNLDSTAKENVGYKFHTDEQGNIPAGKAYWGDTNGMVGYGNASYSINGTAVIAQGTNGFNLFKTEANYE